MKKITRKNLKKFLGKHATDKSVLDIGGGRTESNHSYHSLFPNRHCVDIDPERKPDTVADAHNLPFDDNSFEFILCTEVLEHLHTPQKAIDEMRRVLIPGGKLILTTRFVFPIHDAPHDYFRYTKYGLGYLLREWKAVEITPETETFSAIGALLQRVGFQTKIKGGKIVKLFIYLLAYLFDKSNWLIIKEYGDIGKNKENENIMTTGYYVCATKNE
jgi:SAM-dependent methyltransferase